MPACLCAWVRPIANRLPLLVLQHPQEAAQAKGSLRLLGLSLSACRVQVGDSFDPAALTAWLGPPGSSLLLYPDAPGAPPRPADALPQPAQLVLLDGTWRQARALLRRHPALQALPRWALPAVAPSRYRIRRAQQPAQRSTLEAACTALGQLEDRPAHYAPLLAAFSGWVDAVAARAEAGCGG
ncbi:DTW domain-containing protein [Rubrivivax pictus]|uniref:tRNA-uridine aminocarboxypropyltransferase n=1 Tax=Pseudaquabacterium pictum TaxID=2315236 RepID=A0A480AQI7_9BURK|nr:DTW domain-containing protein [Rubrivivax pictus]